MQVVKIQLEGDGCWPDLTPEIVKDPAKNGVLSEVAYLKFGMVGGNPSVTMRCTMDDGSVVLIQTSARMFVAAAAAIKGKCEKDGIDV